jgi:hypothetical protein
MVFCSFFLKRVLCGSCGFGNKTLSVSDICGESVSTVSIQIESIFECPFSLHTILRFDERCWASTRDGLSLLDNQLCLVRSCYYEEYRRQCDSRSMRRSAQSSRRFCSCIRSVYIFVTVIDLYQGWDATRTHSVSKTLTCVSSVDNVTPFDADFNRLLACLPLQKLPCYPIHAIITHSITIATHTYASHRRKKHPSTLHVSFNQSCNQSSLTSQAHPSQSPQAPHSP